MPRPADLIGLCRPAASYRNMQVLSRWSKLLSRSFPRRWIERGRPTEAAFSLHLGPFFLQFAAEQYLMFFARSVPIFEQVFTGHLTPFPLAPLTPAPWAFALQLNKNGNSPMAAMATIFRIFIPPTGCYRSPTKWSVAREFKLVIRRF